MAYKEQLIKLKNEILIKINKTNIDTFSQENETNIYRLYYIKYYRRNISTSKNQNIGMINWSFKPFTMPSGMTQEEGFKVLSYLTDYIEKDPDITPYTVYSAKVIDNLLDIERLGFKRIEEKNEDKILNLFTIIGDIKYFKKNPLYKKYIEWYHPNITFEEVKAIYNKYNIEFYDLIPLSNDNENNYTRTLKK